MAALTVVPAPLSALAAASSQQFQFVYELKTQDEARSYCREHYADLATVESLEDAVMLDKMADRSRLTNPNGFPYRAWIGLYDDVNTWSWSLSDPAYYSEGQENYRNWFVEEPGNQGGNEFCVMTNLDGFWRDVSCTMQYFAICVDLKGLFGETLVLTTAALTWEEAQQYCRQHHTDLASVRDAAQNAQLQALVGSNPWVWFGLRRQPWRWLDGNNSTFTYWKSGQPDNGASNEHCVAANFEDAGKWEDWSCDFKTAFICSGWPVKNYRIKLQVKTMSVNLNEPEVTEEVRSQIKQHLRTANATELLNVRWAEDANGTVFNKKIPTL
ncbi:hypothetical protein WMY93_027508 [Mugilogobius chulae]|uniref:C-type lectin domain-containing protein n=1 Tax=Mugilogobius chulae TaxID=88201 RepID=A0AAW0MXC2_9GOBI